VVISDIIELADAREPVLLNTWKHHAGVLRNRIRQAEAAGAAGLDPLARQLVVMGGELMDLYTGKLSPEDVGEQVLADLRVNERLELPAFRDWLNKAGGYAVLTLSDDSSWVLRLGDEGGRYVHAHPGRWALHTCRVRANVLKTAVLSLAFAAIHGRDPHDMQVVNQVRRDYLKLAPLGRGLRSDQGIGSIIDVLMNEE
jgi:hypothetical protein